MLKRTLPGGTKDVRVRVLLVSPASSRYLISRLVGEFCALVDGFVHVIPVDVTSQVLQEDWQ